MTHRLGLAPARPRCQLLGEAFTSSLRTFLEACAASLLRHPKRIAYTPAPQTGRSGFDPIFAETP
ncbi:hypothetical protein MMB17_08875 [Methylobacterium organophilum]|uniref:hypothetical protein n=1 Tax=Methylobacterium organophilum TaxID=410 RepID=UPI001F137531|nr:hypothetical protein [Methylobacterium organophilum]UMY19391.1 hypothetical protein MMB17_08875 [Methylobacterium organophilum]